MNVILLASLLGDLQFEFCSKDFPVFGSFMLDICSSLTYSKSFASVKLSATIY